MSLCAGLDLLGLIALVFLVLLFLNVAWKMLYNNFIGHALGHAISPNDMGGWAVITGATDGIGKAYAEEVASKGVNVVLLSRNMDKLRNVASNIEAKWAVKTRVIQVDFTCGTEIYDRIASELKDLDIGVLINNVGMTVSYNDRLGKINNSTAHADSMIKCNVMSVTRMTLIVIERMVARKKGFILNVSSTMSRIPGPLNTMYTSTKAFIRKFTEDLRIEYAPLGVKVQLVMPGFVVTNMIHIKYPTWLAPLPKDFVRSQMKTWGLVYESCGYWAHDLQWLYFKFMRAFFYELGVKMAVRFWEDVRELVREELVKKSRGCLVDTTEESENPHKVEV